ncbi:MAG TPA: sugar-transfer associated ATP-grasp domain-containing protein [Gemmatimonadales bacterium]|nr:sugar-transfer associated ATP-grasp domain-containing protein [Gemmatimonadales bacterium]
MPLLDALRERTATVRSRPLELIRKLRWTRILETLPDSPLREKLRWWPRGFRVESARLYGFPGRDPTEYVSDFWSAHRSRWFNPSDAFFEHKAARRAMLVAMGAAQVEAVGLLFRGRVVLHPFDPRQRVVSTEELEQWLLADGGEFIVKPEDGGKGKGVFLVRAVDGQLVRHGGGSEVPFRIAECHERMTVIERRAEQAPFWRNLFPATVNTIRMLTLWREGEREPFLAAATQKIGTAASIPVDNFAQGGLAVPVDIDTGRLGAARIKADVRQRLPRHPETGTPIEGVYLPGWRALCDEILRITAAFPGDCFVGWDVFRDAAGRTVIVEANGWSTGVQILQMETGLLRNPRVRAFYQDAERRIGVKV